MYMKEDTTISYNLLISQVSGYVCSCLMAFTYKSYKTQ